MSMHSVHSTFMVRVRVSFRQRYIFMQMMPNYISMFRTVEMLIFYSKKLIILRVGPTSTFKTKHKQM